MTEGFYKINTTIPSPYIRSAPPFTQERLNMRSPVNVNLTSHGVGRWLAAAEIINGYLITNGYCQIEFNIIP